MSIIHVLTWKWLNVAAGHGLTALCMLGIFIFNMFCMKDMKTYMKK